MISSASIVDRIHPDRSWIFGTLLLLLGLIGFSPLAMADSPAPLTTAVVHTSLGPVQGTVRDHTFQYLGIPYAAPPVGRLRWAPPQPAAPWSGTYQATTYGNGCPQVARYGLTEAGYNEDCLSLNIAVPTSPSSSHQRRPVIVWLYGGAFVGGSSALYPLARLATSGNVIAVSLNYRIGVFGFMADPAFPAADNGGFGLEDQRAALRWVEQNIAAFGGDPNKVIIAGESAGAASVCMHIIAPKQTNGLFQGAIIQSAGCAQHLKTVAEAAKTGEAVADLAGCPPGPDTLACLRAKPVKTLIEAGAKIGGSDVMSFAPSIGSDVDPMQGPDALRSGQFVHVPIINGGNAVELRLYVAYALQAGAKVTPQNYLSILHMFYGANASAVAAEYPLSAYSSAPAALGSVLSDFIPSNGLNNCVFLETGYLARRYVNVFQYQFADPNPPPVTNDPGFEMGAVHSSELPYEFPHFSNTTKLDGPDLTRSQTELGKIMLAYWTSFARTGKPTAGAAPAWPAFRGDGDVMRLAPARYGLFDAAAAHKCGFWRKLYPSLLQP
jgi:para-nitrobenzyl esterase